MRWKRRKPGCVRNVRRFLLFPKCINDEWRWLETATYRQKLCRGHLTGIAFWESYNWLADYLVV